MSSPVALRRSNSAIGNSHGSSSSSSYKASSPNSPNSRNASTLSGVGSNSGGALASPSDDVRKWIHSFKELPASTRKARLICFHWAGSNAMAWRPLSVQLEKHGIEVKALMLPGRLSRAREPLVRSVHAIVDNTFQSMQLHGLLDGQVRTILYGHSYGSLIAYELARLIEARCGERAISHLVVSSLECPHGVQTRYRDISKRKHLFTDNDLMKALSNLGGMEGVDQELLRAALPVIRADFTGLETYTVRNLSNYANMRRDSSFGSDTQLKDAAAGANGSASPAAPQGISQAEANLVLSPTECADGRLVRPEHKIKCPMTVMGGGHDVMVPLDNLVGWLYYSQHGPMHDQASANNGNAPTTGASASVAPTLVSRSMSEGSMDSFSHASVQATIRPYTRHTGLGRDAPVTSRGVRLFIDPVGTHFFHQDKAGGEDWVREVLIQTCIN